MLAARCPDCPTARAARTWFFDDSFTTYLLYAALPFALVLVLVWLVAHWLARKERS